MARFSELVGRLAADCSLMELLGQALRASAFLSPIALVSRSASVHYVEDDWLRSCRHALRVEECDPHSSSSVG
jgi:hypothetical protein